MCHIKTPHTLKKKPHTNVYTYKFTMLKRRGYFEQSWAKYNLDKNHLLKP